MQLKLSTISFLVLIFFLFGCKKDNENFGQNEKFNSFPDSLISKIAIDNDGIKWIGTNNGLLSFDGKLFTKWTNMRLINNTITDIYYSNYNNSLWLATKNGAKEIFLESGSIKSINEYSTENGLLSNSVKAVAVGDSGKCFFGTDIGLSIFQNSKQISFLGNTQTYKNSKILRDYEISDIAYSKNGWIYVSTKGGGISRFKYDIDAVTGATTFMGRWSALGSWYYSDIVNTVIIVDDTCQWYGTNEGVALHSSHLARENWKYYSTYEGLICDTVLAIAKDKTGNVWFGTPKGISKFDISNNWTDFSVDNGLINNKINTIAVDIDNSVWFGTDMGLSHFKSNVWVNYIK